MEKEAESPNNDLQLIEHPVRGQDVTIRDDQHSFYWLLDSVNRYRWEKSRFRLIDTGKLECSQIEQLCLAGADIYTSDEAGRALLDLEFIRKASKKGKSIVAYFFNGSLESGKEGDYPEFTDLVNLARMGIYFYITNREEKRDFSLLKQWAHECHKGGSWLVYYHLGALEPELSELGDNGAWIHVSDRSIREAEDIALLMDVIKSTCAAGANLILHYEQKLNAAVLRDILKAGAFIFFKSSLIDYKSPLRPIEDEAKRKRLDYKAYYVYPTFLL